MGKPFAARNVGRESWRHRVRHPEGVVVLASGGIDSCALIGEMARRGREVFPLFVRCGLIWERRERRSLAAFLKALPVPLKRRVRALAVASLPMDDLYRGHWSTTGEGTPGWRAADNSVYLPGRNIILLTKAAVHAAMLGVPRISIGLLSGNVFPDASKRFLSSLQRTLAAGLDFPLAIEAPFLGKDKAALIREGTDLPLHLTFSCSSPAGGRACGSCAKCRERTLAFRAA